MAERAGARLTVLGAGSILPRRDYGSAGYALEAEGEVTLLDCGPGSLRALGAAGIPLEKVRRVVFSHYHPDHCLDLFALAFARRNPSFADRPALDVYGPEGLLDLAAGGEAAFAHGARDPEAHHHELPLVDDAAGFEAGGLRFLCAKNGHCKESVSWRVEGAGWSLVYSGDSDEDPALARLAREADLFLCECSFPDEEATANHLSPSSAARLADQGGVGTLVLTHFYPSLEPAAALETAARTFGGAVEAARDGRSFALGAD